MFWLGVERGLDHPRHGGQHGSLEPRLHRELLSNIFLATMSRPEHQAPPEIYYGDTEARKYTAKCVT